jgi:hypothetical protein
MPVRCYGEENFSYFAMCRKNVTQYYILSYVEKPTDQLYILVIVKIVGFF